MAGPERGERTGVERAADGDAAGHRRARMRAGLVALVVAVALFAAKLVAWRMTGSSAVLSDALESIINVVAGALLLVSLAIAARPPDQSHPYGHGKVEFFSAGFEGAAIAMAALAIFFESTRALLRGPELRNLDAGLGIVLAAGLANALLGGWLLRVGRRTRSLSIVADGRHVLTDVVTSAGVLVGLAVVWLTGLAWLDPVVAMAVGVNILWTGWQLVREAVGGLMDEADHEILRPVVAALERAREPEWIDLHDLRAWRSGREQHVDLHLVVPRWLDVEQTHAIEQRVTRVVLGALGLPGDVIVHFDPCRPPQCPDCIVSPCSVRAADARAREPFTLERATRRDVPPPLPPPHASRARAS